MPTDVVGLTQIIKMKKNIIRTSTVQYRPSENKIVFGLKVPSGDGLGLILSLK